MSFKRPFNEISIDELNQKMIRLIYYFEQGEELSDEKLDYYNLLKKRILELNPKHNSKRNIILQVPIDGTMVIVEIFYPFVNWKNYSLISGLSRMTPNHFLKNYKEVSEGLLINSYKKLKEIDERMSNIVKVYDDMSDEVSSISILEDDLVKDRIISKLYDWFYGNYIFNSSVTSMITTISDKPQIEQIIKEYKSTKRKIYLR